MNSKLSITEHNLGIFKCKFLFIFKSFVSLKLISFMKLNFWLKYDYFIKKLEC